MDTSVAENMRFTVSIAERDECKPENFSPQGSCRLQFFADTDGIPKVNVHIADPTIRAFSLLGTILPILVHDRAQTQQLEDLDALQVNNNQPFRRWHSISTPIEMACKGWCLCPLPSGCSTRRCDFWTGCGVKKRHRFQQTSIKNPPLASFFFLQFSRTANSRYWPLAAIQEGQNPNHGKSEVLSNRFRPKADCEVAAEI